MKALEATCNTVIGLALGWALLSAYGLPWAHAWALQGVFFIASWVRSYALRCVFARFANA